MHILLAYDQKELTNVLRTIFENNKYSVDIVCNGNDALAYARSGEYNCIIMDIILPGMSSLQVLKKLREEKYYIPIILLADRNDSESAIDALNSGADDYMQKPFAAIELLARVKAMLRRANSYIPDEL